MVTVSFCCETGTCNLLLQLIVVEWGIQKCERGCGRQRDRSSEGQANSFANAASGVYGVETAALSLCEYFFKRLMKNGSLFSITKHTPSDEVNWLKIELKIKPREFSVHSLANCWKLQFVNESKNFWAVVVMTKCFNLTQMWVQTIQPFFNFSILLLVPFTHLVTKEWNSSFVKCFFFCFFLPPSCCPKSGKSRNESSFLLFSAIVHSF